MIEIIGRGGLLMIMCLLDPGIKFRRACNVYNSFTHVEFYIIYSLALIYFAHVECK